MNVNSTKIEEVECQQVVNKEDLEEKGIFGGDIDDDAFGREGQDHEAEDKDGDAEHEAVQESPDVRVGSTPVRPLRV